MTKKYICVQGSPEIPKETIAEYNNSTGVYGNYVLKCSNPTAPSIQLHYWQVEGNECWEEVEEETKEEEKPTRWKPTLFREKYYTVSEDGYIREDVFGFDDDEIVERLLEVNNCFQTEQEARDELKRRESIANAWIPKEGQVCWVWGYYSKQPVKCMEYGEHNTPDAYVGACHPTEEACQKWGETYAKYFLPKTT